MGSEAGNWSGARVGGSRNIWCETLLCLYLCPRRRPTSCHSQHQSICMQDKGIRTGLLACGLLGMYWTDWKLKGFGFGVFLEPLDEGASFSLVALIALVGVSGKVALAGLKTVLGVPLWDCESFNASVP
jgi:hypothetical protein